MVSVYVCGVSQSVLAWVGLWVRWTWLGLTLLGLAWLELGWLDCLALPCPAMAGGGTPSYEDAPAYRAPSPPPPPPALLFFFLVVFVYFQPLYRPMHPQFGNKLFTDHRTDNLFHYSTLNDLDLPGRADVVLICISSSSCCRMGASIIRMICCGTGFLGWICAIQILNNTAHRQLGI